MDTTKLDDLLNQAEAQESEQGEWIEDINYITKNFYVDEHGVVEIKNKTIGDMSKHISVKGESYSQYIEFKIGRFFDGIDLTKMQLAIYFNIPNVGEDESSPINVYYNENEIKFGWVIPPEVAQVNLTIEFCIYARGKLSDGNNYVLKTKTAKYSINDGLEIGSGIIEPTNNWYLNFVLQMDEKVSQATESADRAVQAASSLDGVVETVTTARDEVVQKASTVDTQHSEVRAWHQESEQFRNEAEQFRNQAEAIVGIGLAEEGKPGLVQPDGITTKVDENGKLIVIGGGSGGGGTTDYQVLENKPSIAGIELSGDKSYDELGLVSKDAVARNFQTVNQNIQDLDDYTQSLGEDISTIDTELEQTNQQLQSTTDKVDDVQESIEAGFKKQARGEEIHTTDAVDGKLVEFAMYGKSEQNTTSGKNLLENVTTTRTTNNVTFTVNKDKSVTVNGTASGTASVNVGTIKCDKLSVGAKYIYADNYETTQNVLTFIDQYLADGTWEKVVSVNGNPFEVTEADISDGKYLVFGIRVLSGKTANNVTVYPMLRISTNTAEYEPYTGGQPSPNPNYPQEIEIAGASGSVEVKSVGKNLLNQEPFRLTNDGTNRTKNIYFDLPPNKYIFECKWSGNATSLGVQFYNEQWQMLNTTVTSGKPIEISTSFNFKRMYMFVPSEDVSGNYADVYDIMISTVGGDYQPYKETKSIILTPNGLPGIKVASGGNYTDDNGQQWITDEIRKYADGSGEYIQRIYKEVLNGSENWSLNTVNSYGICNFNTKPQKVIAIAQMSSHFVHDGRTIAVIDAPSFNITYANIFLRMDSSVVSDVNALKAWLSENNVTVCYELAEPIVTKLTSEQLSEIEKLQTFKPITNISNNEQCGMKITYATLQEALMLQEALNGSKSNAEEISNVKEEIVDVKKDLADTTFKVDTIIAKADLGIKETSSGEDIHLNDSANAKVREFALYGKAKQNTTSGKNKLKNINDKKVIQNGITFEQNEDGGIHIYGTRTDTNIYASYQLDFKGNTHFQNIPSELKNVPLRYFLNNNAINGLSLFYGYFKEDKTPIQIGSTGSFVTFTNPDEAYYYRNWIQVKVDTIDVTVYPMICLATEDFIFEPYTNGASPNPDYPQEIEVSGASYNLLENTATSKEVNGVTFTVNEDGSVTVKGTHIGTQPIYYSLNNQLYLNKGKYIYSGVSGGSSSTYKLFIRNEPIPVQWTYNVYDGETEFTIKEDNTCVAPHIQVNAGVTIDITFYPMLRKASVKNTRYMPYGVDRVEVKSVGKNLFSELLDGVTLLGDDALGLSLQKQANSHTLIGKVKPNKDYIVKKYSDGNRFRIVLFKDYPTYTATFEAKTVTFDNSYNEYAFNSLDYNYVVFTINYNNASITTKNAQLERGTVATPYQPYKESKAIINGKFAGIKVSSGGNYTDKSGQQWICDEVVKYADGSGAFVQRIGKLTNAVFTKQNGYTVGNSELFTVKAPNSQTNLVAIKSVTLCDKLSFNRAILNNEVYGMYQGYGSIFARIPNVTTADEFNSLMSDSVIYYQLETPIETPLTAEELAEISTFYPVTNISNDFDCGMKVTYLVDSKLYIDNRLALQAQVREQEMMAMFLLLPDEVQAAMIENDTNNLMSGMED